MSFLLAGGAAPIAVLAMVVALTVTAGSARAVTPRTRVAWRALAGLLWLISVAGVLYMTLALANPGGGGVNLVPFDEIGRQMARSSRSLAIFNVIGNLLLLVPFGLLAHAAWRWAWWPTTLVAAIFSTGIEACQFLTGRTADIDDVLLNTAGASLAAAVAITIHWVVRVVRQSAARRQAPAPGSRDFAPPTMPLPTTAKTAPLPVQQ